MQYNTMDLSLSHFIVNSIRFMLFATLAIRVKFMPIKLSKLIAFQIKLKSGIALATVFESGCFVLNLVTLLWSAEQKMLSDAKNENSTTLIRLIISKCVRWFTFYWSSTNTISFFGLGNSKPIVTSLSAHRLYIDCYYLFKYMATCNINYKVKQTSGNPYSCGL